MIRMIQSQNADHAKAYFTEALAKADYYINDQELKGQIRGKLADRLGISGPATKDIFFKLCENINPATGKGLTPLTQEKRTIGYDINFHCPKSVSIIHALSDNDHILNAFQDSVTETMQDIESDMKTRVRLDGQVDERQTNEVVWADFIHQTARPVDGQPPDPHLHNHSYIWNATWDATENRIKAGQFRDIKRDMPYYQARFHKRLSDRLIDLGYDIRVTDKSFEIEGVPQRVIDLFSKRTDEIGRIAREKGITDASELDQLGARTRAKKQNGMRMDELKAHWRQQIQALGPGEEDEGRKAVRFAPETAREVMIPQHCVDHALAHGFERASVLHDRRLLASAYRYGMGDKSITLDNIDKSFRADTRLIHVKDGGRVMNTTREVLAEERRMIALARAARGKAVPLYKKAPKINLDGQQAQAVRHVLTTADRISIIRGAAGSGKTTLMKEAISKIEKAGKTVTVVAPTSQASRGVLRDEGFEDAQTVAQLLVDPEMQKNLKKQVLWVDEAGLLGTREMTQLLQIATQRDARLILGGDTRQHASVVRGDALRILNTVGGIQAAEVSKIYRQKRDGYRSIVEDLSNGNVARAFEKLDKAGSIQEIDPLDPNKQLIQDYSEALGRGKSALVISPTHEQSLGVTKSIREHLRKSGLLGRRELNATRYINLNLTQAEKADWRNLPKGQMVQFNQNLPDIKRGSIWEIERSSDHSVHIKDRQNEVMLPTDKSASFEVYRRSKIDLAKGDIVRITRNSFDREKNRLNNGQLLHVESVRKNGKIVLANPTSKCKYHIDKDFGHLTHAYCVTSHASQGKTVDEVFLYQPASTFAATNSKQLYVSVSRGRERVMIYTDEKKDLLEQSKKIGDRKSAIELLTDNDKTRSTQHQKIRNDLYTHAHKSTVEPVDIQPASQRAKHRDYEPGV
ncbi:relaxase domain-containing protein [Dyadobacter sp. CY261]|uniref:MobF family relaxase n=1 Tax=Dyadobacter sp. CY261 TaxID=2907203 RepID=UPI001F2DA0E0|nr:MobF family relaxase [Dyadobacter sp. CY261]MCF0072453.1 relaxase domain-containing protein [Dyadobacter sp. CY261]